MKISVKVKANSSREKVEKIDDSNYLVWVRAKPADGKANEAVVKVLSGHFGIAKSKVTLIKGQSSRRKVFEINAPHLSPRP